MKDQAHKNMLA